MLVTVACRKRTCGGANTTRYVGRVIDTSGDAGDTLAFWQAEAAGYEERARAEGHQIQSCLGLAVTVVAGGVVAAGFDALAVPVVSGIVAFSLWLLALLSALHWAEMVALAAKRTASEDRVESLLSDPDATVFRRLQINRSSDGSGGLPLSRRS